MTNEESAGTLINKTQFNISFGIAFTIFQDHRHDVGTGQFENHVRIYILEIEYETLASIPPGPFTLQRIRLAPDTFKPKYRFVSIRRR